MVKQVFDSITNGDITCTVVATDPYVVSMSVEMQPILAEARQSACLCGLRHANKRACLRAPALDNICFEERVDKKCIGRCPLCPSTIRNDNSFVCHLVDAHGYRSPYRAFAFEDGICRACSVCFHNRTRLLAHLSGRLSNGSKCFTHCVVAGIDPLSEQQMCKLDEDARVHIHKLKALGRGSKTTEGKICYKTQSEPCELQIGPLPLWTARWRLQQL